MDINIFCWLPSTNWSIHSAKSPVEDSWQDVDVILALGTLYCCTSLCLSLLILRGISWVYRNQLNVVAVREQELDSLFPFFSADKFSVSSPNLSRNVFYFSFCLTDISVQAGAPCSTSHPPPAPVRLYVYALHGCLCEVAFTALWDWCGTRDTRLAGRSSLWALPMYASAIYLMESLRACLLAQHQPLPVRLTAYTVFIYLWEFSWGAGLRLLGACPWDYSGYRYNLGGLVTLEYAVPWAGAAFIAEQHVIKNTLRMRLS